jgi:ferric-dicitrate binding protein FerR (iron transport regulator)
MARLASALALAAAAALAPVAASAQTLVAGCSVTVASDPPRRVLTCAAGLVIEAEAAAVLSLSSGTATQPPRRATVRRGAVYVTAQPGAGGFQIRTPHAIASVRGTEYAVDVAAGTTAVFVREGRVSVTEAAAPGGVTLGPGEGVDVAPGQPLAVRTWGVARRDALLARFGR